MNHLGKLLAALILSTGCGSAIGPNQPDGSDCNYATADTACGPASFCDPGEPGPDGNFLRIRKYGLTGDKTHVVGTCRPKGGAGVECLGNEQCVSAKCTHGPAPRMGAKGVCQ
jgi:hypothetical protein